MMPIRVALVEDDKKFRESLAAMLSHAGDIECVAQFASAESAMNQLLDYHPDVVLVDIGLPKASGIDAIRYLKAREANLLFLVLTVFEDDEKIFPALAAGASGYLLKIDAPERIAAAIRDVKNGGAAMSPQIARHVIEFFRQPPLSEEAAKLTEREKEVLRLLAEGYTYKEISEKLHPKISEHTVRTHIHHIY